MWEFLTKDRKPLVPSVLAPLMDRVAALERENESHHQDTQELRLSIRKLWGKLTGGSKKDGPDDGVLDLDERIKRGERTA